MNQSRIYILTAKQGEGKTTRCLEIFKTLKSKGKSVGGIVAPGFWENDIRSGFELMDVNSTQRIPFAQRVPRKDWLKIKAFYFNPEAIMQGELILRSAVQEKDWILLDEIGKLDIEGNLWGPIFTELVQKSNKIWIISVRDIFVDEVIQHWQLQNVKILDLNDKFEF